MNIRKLTRNPGWSRLFRVFTLLWYVVIVFFFVQGFIEQEQRMNKEFGPAKNDPVAGRGLSIDEDLERLRNIDFSKPPPEGYVVDQPVPQSKFGGVPVEQLDEADRKKRIAELEARLEEIYAEERFTKRKSLSLVFMPFAFFPWILLFFMRLFRYVIEGFSSEGSP